MLNSIWAAESISLFSRRFSHANFAFIAAIASAGGKIPIIPLLSMPMPEKVLCKEHHRVNPQS